MTTISIVPEIPGALPTTYRALAGKFQSVGNTVGQALDALTPRLGTQESTTLIVVQRLQPDQFFTARQQQRLQELLECWRTARAANTTLPPAEQAELEALVAEEVRAAAQRAAALLQGLAP